jgi:hypothetical protein
MKKWRRRYKHHRRTGGTISNANIAIYLFAILFSVWLVFQVWARFGGGTPPAGLDPMVMAALGVAVAGKSVERSNRESDVDEQLENQRQEIEKLRKLANEAHPDLAEEGESK